MPVIAVAGGSGGLGRALVEAVLKRGGHEVFVLSRQGSTSKTPANGAKVLSVDYNDTASLSKALDDANIHTVIAALDSNAGSAPELALIQAAEQSRTTKRYIPCNWAIDYTPDSILQRHCTSILH